MMAFAAIVAFASCSEKDDLGAYKSITIPETFAIERGRVMTIEVLDASPAGYDSRIEWCEVEDLNESITINRISGEITAARAGQATIKAYSIDGSEVESNICIVTVTPDISGNLVVGGTFENYVKATITNDWSLTATNIEVEGVAASVVSGKKSARLTGLTAKVGLYQLVRGLEPGALYEFGFAGRIQSSAGAEGVVAATDLNLSISMHADNDGKVGVPISSTAAIELMTGETSENSFVRGRMTIPDGVTSAYIYIYKAAGIGYVDDVYIRKVE